MLVVAIEGVEAICTDGGVDMLIDLGEQSIFEFAIFAEANAVRIISGLKRMLGLVGVPDLEVRFVTSGHSPDNPDRCNNGERDQQHPPRNSSQATDEPRHVNALSEARLNTVR